MIVLVALDEHLLVVGLAHRHHARLALEQAGARARPVGARLCHLVLGERERAHLQLSAVPEALGE